MKSPILICLNRNHLPLLLAALLPVGLGAAEAPVPGAGGDPDDRPRIQFAETVFNFEKVVGGQSVRHDYYFTNTGTAVLKITSVNASCGCTTAGQWTREVPPGGTGVIPLQFNSGSFSGAVTKTATVACNDPASPSVTLQIKGAIWRPVEVTPTMAMLSVNSELISNATAVVRIVNHAPEPLAVYEPASSNPQFAAELRTNAPGREFEVVVHSVPPLNIANPHGNITLQSSSTNTPVITFSAMCVVQPSVVINPPRIIIPDAQFTNDWTSVVRLRNGMNRPLQLSEPRVNVPGARVDLREVEPGRAYEATVVLPTSARNPMVAAELFLKSNFADYPTIHVPIMIVGANNAITANGVPLTARANRYLNSPEGRRAVEPQPEDYLSDDDAAGDAAGATQPATAPK